MKKLKLMLAVALITVISVPLIACGKKTHKHTWVEGDATAATCLTAGVKNFTCSGKDCEDKKTEPGEAALGHDETAAAATCVTAKKCKRAGCDVTLTPATGVHTPGAAAENGEVHCTICDGVTTAANKVLASQVSAWYYDAEIGETNLALNWTNDDVDATLVGDTIVVTVPMKSNVPSGTTTVELYELDFAEFFKEYPAKLGAFTRNGNPGQAVELKVNTDNPETNEWYLVGTNTKYVAATHGTALYVYDEEVAVDGHDELARAIVYINAATVNQVVTFDFGGFTAKVKLVVEGHVYVDATQVTAWYYVENSATENPALDWTKAGVTSAYDNGIIVLTTPRVSDSIYELDLTAFFDANPGMLGGEDSTFSFTRNGDTGVAVEMKTNNDDPAANVWVLYGTETVYSSATHGRAIYVFDDEIAVDGHDELARIVTYIAADLEYTYVFTGDNGKVAEFKVRLEVFQGEVLASQLFVWRHEADLVEPGDSALNWTEDGVAALVDGVIVIIVSEAGDWDLYELDLTAFFEANAGVLGKGFTFTRNGAVGVAVEMETNMDDPAANVWLVYGTETVYASATHGRALYVYDAEVAVDGHDELARIVTYVGVDTEYEFVFTGANGLMFTFTVQVVVA